MKTIEKVNQILKKTNISKVNLAKYLGVSRQMVYNYLDCDSLDKWPKDKKNLLFNLLEVEDVNELNNIEIDDLSDARMNLRSIRCGAGVSDLAINYDGWVYPCGNLISEKFKLFNILEITTLEDAMKRTRDEYLIGNSLRSIQPDHYEKCKECDVNLFCWSCVEEIARLQNNEREFKERCINHKKVLEKILWDE